VFWIRMHIEDRLDEILSGREKAALKRRAEMAEALAKPSVFWCKMLDDERYEPFHGDIEELAQYGLHDLLARVLDDLYEGEVLEDSSVKSKVKFMKRALPVKGAPSRKERLSKVGLLAHLFEVAKKAAAKHPHRHMRSGLVVAALLHDAGKCPGLCRNYGIDERFGHEAAGAQYAKILASEFPEASILLDAVAASLDPAIDPKLRRKARQNVFVALVAEADKETRIQESKENR